MENKINIAEILKDCPKGMKLYSLIYGEVELSLIDDTNDNYPICIKTNLGSLVNFTKDGRYAIRFPTAECLLFPSSKMRDWSKFFKRGDVVYSKEGKICVIFEGWTNDDYTEFNTTINFYVDDASYGEEEICYTNCFVKASDEERATFIANAEKHYNGKYNPETLQVEPIKPECPFKPFDKVLVRYNDEMVWKADYFSHYKDNDYHYCCIGNSYRDCIPFNDQTAHLLGTTDPYTEGGSE